MMDRILYGIQFKYILCTLEEPGQTPHIAASDQGLPNLHRFVLQ